MFGEHVCVGYLICKETYICMQMMCACVSGACVGGCVFVFACALYIARLCCCCVCYVVCCELLLCVLYCELCVRCILCVL